MNTATTDIITIETFNASFEPQTFISHISSDIPADASALFNPKPYIRTFEAVSSHLHKIKKQITKRIEDLEDMSLVYEEQFTGKMVAVEGKFKVYCQTVF